MGVKNVWVVHATSTMGWGVIGAASVLSILRIALPRLPAVDSSAALNGDRMASDPGAQARRLSRSGWGSMDWLDAVYS
jgi:hypothetical protein